MVLGIKGYKEGQDPTRCKVRSDLGTESILMNTLTYGCKGLLHIVDHLDSLSPGVDFIPQRGLLDRTRLRPDSRDDHNGLFYILWVNLNLKSFVIYIYIYDHDFFINNK